MDYVRRKAIKIQQMQRCGVKSKQLAYSQTQPLTLTSEKNTKTMVGFDDLLLQLLDMLTGHPSSRRVIPIVGTGGVGKTTLARNAFEHSLIIHHFDVCLWATISQEYVAQDILLTLLSHEEKFSSETVGELREKLHKKLFGRRYLIVLDDIWSVTAWDEMNSWFPDTISRSRIIVTTRQSHVVDHIGSTSLAISLLDNDKSWDLFCQKTFAGKGCPTELEDVGRNIVRKCKGLPLSIVVIAGHLRKVSLMQESWEDVAKNMKSILNSAENNQVLNILSFSYTHLPVHLKPCFVYMATYVEDKRIYVPELINCWIAEGLLKPCKAKKLEEIARDYLKDLIDRNLILDSTRKSGRSGYTHCKIHDLLRELCLRVAQNEMFFYLDDTGRAIYREQSKKLIHAPSLVRSLKLRTGEQSFDLRLCRILMFDEVLANEGDGGFLEADLQYFNLQYLEYFRNHQSNMIIDVSYYLPSSISLFWNLRTLIIREGFYSSVIAPDEIWDMVQLRHLQVISGIHLPDPLASDKLNHLVMQNLHTLMIVENLKFSEEVCRRVSSVKKLEMRYYCDDVMSYYCPHNLGCLQKLETLALSVARDGHRDSSCREFVLSLIFPCSLKKLTLKNTHLDWEEMTTMVGSLPHLEVLYLNRNSVKGSTWSLVEGKFLRLKSLNIFFCSDLVNWNAASSHFPRLEILDIWSVSRLNELPSDLGSIPTLQSITLRRCSVSLAICAVRMLVEQEEEEGNYGLKLEVDLLGQGQRENFSKTLEEEGLASKSINLRLR